MRLSEVMAKPKADKRVRLVREAMRKAYRRSESKDNRTRLVHAAMVKAYRNGFGRTALVDIAREARIPVGNVYYYFKTKDEIGEAIVERRLARLKELLRGLDAIGGPRERLLGFVQIKVEEREELARSGCPVGTLCSELHKDRGPVAKKATILFAEVLTWLEAQFRALGKSAESRGLAVHLLSATQGVSLLAYTFHDAGIIDGEAARLKEWVQRL
jgi:AcrR family transcriptional regulator